MLHDLARWLGLTDATGAWYLWWSGPAGSLTILGAVIAVTRRRTCDVARCWRPGRYPISGTSFMVCRRHHPDPASTHYTPVLIREGEPTTPLEEVNEKLDSPVEGG